jgi:hypothetical protein
MNVVDPLPVIDGLLAASAKIRGWTLVTRNVPGNVGPSSSWPRAPPSPIGVTAGLGHEVL